ncbi:hypothetical protein ACSVHC_14990 [Arthrobacter sp. KNU-44]
MVGVLLVTLVMLAAATAVTVVQRMAAVREQAMADVDGGTPA